MNTRPTVTVEAVGMAVFLDMLDRIATKLEDGEDPAELARHIRRIITASEGPRNTQKESDA